MPVHDQQNTHVVQLLKITVILDRNSNLLRWEGRTNSGPDVICFPLTDIAGVLIEEYESRKSGTVYRVALQKKDGSIFPLSKSYSNGQAHYKNLRKNIEAFLFNTVDA